MRGLVLLSGGLACNGAIPIAISNPTRVVVIIPYVYTDVRILKNNQKKLVNFLTVVKPSIYAC